MCVDLSLAGNSGKCAGTDFYQCVQYFYVSKEWYGCQCLEFLSCTQMLMHATARVVCTNSVTESALKVDPGRKEREKRRRRRKKKKKKKKLLYGRVEPTSVLRLAFRSVASAD